MSKILNEDVQRVVNALSFAEAKSKNPELSDMEENQIVDYMKNANELMHTQNTGFGKELVPVEVLQNEILDMIPNYSTFLGDLPGFHGTNMPISAKVAVIGETGFFRGNTEPTTGAQAIPQPGNRLATGEVQINQGQFIADVFLTKRELNYAIGDLEALVKSKLAASMARTVEALILNADSEAGATGNVNSDDLAPVAGSYYLQQNNGLRKLALASSINGGTLDMGDLVDAMNVVGDLASNPSDLLWLFNRRTYNKALQLAEFAKANERGAASTISGNAISNIYGADLFIARDMGLTEADGKISVTPSNNDKGQIGLLYKSAVQWGYGQPMELEVTRVAGKGVQLTATFEFGFAIANKLAGQADPSVATIRNITV